MEGGGGELVLFLKRVILVYVLGVRARWGSGCGDESGVGEFWRRGWRGRRKRGRLLKLR